MAGAAAMQFAWGKIVVGVAGAEIVVGSTQVVPQIVGQINAQGVAAQADHGQEKLQQQDCCPHRGTDHKDVGHRYPLTAELRRPRAIRPPLRPHGMITPPRAAQTPTQVLHVRCSLIMIRWLDIATTSGLRNRYSCLPPGRLVASRSQRSGLAGLHFPSHRL